MNINDYNFAGKKAIVRVDFNVPIQNGVITDDTRIRGAVPTLKLILEKGGALITAAIAGSYQRDVFAVPGRLGDTYSKGTLFVLTIPDDFGNLYDFPAPALNVIRKVMSKDVGAYVEGPSKVALFPYDNKTMVVENFNDNAVSLRVVVNGKVNVLRNLMTGEQLKPAEVTVSRYRFFGYSDNQTVFDLQLPAHSYVALGY